MLSKSQLKVKILAYFCCLHLNNPKVIHWLCAKYLKITLLFDYNNKQPRVWFKSKISAKILKFIKVRSKANVVKVYDPIRSELGLKNPFFEMSVKIGGSQIRFWTQMGNPDPWRSKNAYQYFQNIRILLISPRYLTLENSQTRVSNHFDWAVTMLCIMTARCLEVSKRFLMSQSHLYLQCLSRKYPDWCDYKKISLLQGRLAGKGL